MVSREILFVDSYSKRKNLNISFFISSNMYSHALAAYQKALIIFWEKTSKTMKAVAESFNGYQYYEFTVIKNLAEPSRLLAEKNAKSFDDMSKNDDTLIDINETKNNQTREPITSVEDNQQAAVDPEEPVNALIDISDDQLDDQLFELEKLTTIDRNPSTSISSKTKSNSSDNLADISAVSAEHEKFFSDLLSTISSEKTTVDLLEAHDNNSFDAQWAAAFGNTSNEQHTSTIHEDSTMSNNKFLPSSMLNELLSSMNKGNHISTDVSSSTSKPKSITTKTTEKSSWLNLFAELDPIQNPDAIGKAAGDEADRSC